MLHSLLVLVLINILGVWSGHYKGGTVTWKPTNPNATGSTIQILISEKHSFTLLTRYACSQTTINSQLSYTDAGGTAAPDLTCQSAASSCTSSLYTKINQNMLCTDFSTQLDSSSGAYYTKQYLSSSTNIDIAFTSNSWATVIKKSNGAAADYWYVGTHITLGTVYPINSSPVTGSLPIIRVIENQVATIQIPAADWDLGQTLACRFASDTYGYGYECMDICNNLPGATISASTCTMSWYAVRRPVDISAGLTTSTYVAAIMVEDFAPSVSTTVRLSGVPLQMLIFVYTPATGACSIVPNITGDRPNRACIGVDINAVVSERIVATVYCSGDSVVEFVTSSPLYMRKTLVAPVSGTTNQYYISLTWTPVADQYGPQVFCAAPIDQRKLTGPQYCINFVVGYRSPELNPPISVQGSASPLGTVLSTHSAFSITATTGVNRPTRNGTYIKIYLASNNSLVWSADCGWSPYVLYTASVVAFTVPNPQWSEGETYYVLLDSGAVSGNVFCGPESAPINDPNYWRFNIWATNKSSTTSSTSSPPTTVTVTTRSVATTTAMANATTTGIVVTTTTNNITTTTTSTTSSSTSTTATTTSPTTSTTTFNVLIMTPKELEESCRNPVAISNAGMFASLMIAHGLAMFAFFSKISTKFNPNYIQAAVRHKKFMRRVGPSRR